MNISLGSIARVFESVKSNRKMPLMFVGHGNPMNAILDNEITRGWNSMAEGLTPTAILCISAHWETRGTRVTMVPKPRTIHDFGGFPQELFETQYPAPGHPKIGKEIITNVKKQTVKEDHDWGLDHGAWSVIMKMFPEANVPVLQLSLDYKLTPDQHYELAKDLAFLRNKGVLIVGSGNIVHNLRMAKWNSNEPYDWAVDFDESVKEMILNRNHKELLRGDSINREAKLSIPTPEHYLPLHYILSMQEAHEQVTFFNETIDMGSMSMRSIVISAS